MWRYIHSRKNTSSSSGSSCSNCSNSNREPTNNTRVGDVMALSHSAHNEKAAVATSQALHVLRFRRDHGGRRGKLLSYAWQLERVFSGRRGKKGGNRRWYAALRFALLLEYFSSKRPLCHIRSSAVNDNGIIHTKNNVFPANRLRTVHLRSHGFRRRSSCAPSEHQIKPFRKTKCLGIPTILPLLSIAYTTAHRRDSKHAR